MSLSTFKGGRPSRNRHHVSLYHRRKVQLLASLGGKCVACGATEGLEFDHIRPADWPRNAYSSHHRLKLYAMEATVGNIQLLCADCNKRKSNRRDWQPNLRMGVAA